ncbi:Uncharacterised protein [Candidatus Gugararchaeum adminiculabundum]|nr:Uncharacterised protein [Candidatus Gugararchaeum adminiculabundum]
MIDPRQQTSRKGQFTFDLLLAFLFAFMLFALGFFMLNSSLQSTANSGDFKHKADLLIVADRLVKYDLAIKENGGSSVKAHELDASTVSSFDLNEYKKLTGAEWLDFQVTLENGATLRKFSQPSGNESGISCITRLAVVNLGITKSPAKLLVCAKFGETT